MVGFLKVFLRGIIVTLLLPFILVVWVLYGVYCLFVFFFMLIKSIISFFAGNSAAGDLPEDIEARRMVLEKEKTQQEATQAMSAIYQQMQAQAVVAATMQQTTPAQQAQPFGMEMYAEQPSVEPVAEQTAEATTVEEEKLEEESTNDNSY